MVNGYLKVVRYYPYFDKVFLRPRHASNHPRIPCNHLEATWFGTVTSLLTYTTVTTPKAFAIMKKLTAEQCCLTDDMRQAVFDAVDCHNLYEVMQRDYWVVSACQSRYKPGRTMEGTRLTIVTKGHRRRHCRCYQRPQRQLLCPWRCHNRRNCCYYQHHRLPSYVAICLSSKVNRGTSSPYVRPVRPPGGSFLTKSFSSYGRNWKSRVPKCRRSVTMPSAPEKKWWTLLCYFSFTGSILHL